MHGLSYRLYRQRIVPALIASAVAALAFSSAGAEPLVSETTSKVIGTIAHIIIENVAGSTADRIVGPYVDDALRKYLGGDPEEVLTKQETVVTAKMTDSAAEDITSRSACLDPKGAEPAQGIAATYGDERAARAV